jgi:wyosine [tRNA(Phe)-imidazoG37] synthetase (radical SAM superfamily)
MSNNQALTFGPVNSRRFGISLGIDLSPNSKQCNFDCLYCELDKAPTVTKQNESIKVKEYITAVKKALVKYPETQVITITANGEPTLYPYLDDLVDELNKIKENKKILILSNASLINIQKIVNILNKIDIVKLSMDCASEECFKKLDRIDKDLNYKDILDGLINFSKNYKYEFVLEVLFVDSINNKEKEIQEIYKLLKILNPSRVDIGTIDRPPAYDVKAIGYSQLLNIANSMNDLNISIAHKNKIKLDKFLSEEEILNLLDKRPQTNDDINNLLNNESKIIFDNLFKNNSIKIKNQAGVIFYGRNKSKEV